LSNRSIFLSAKEAAMLRRWLGCVVLVSSTLAASAEEPRSGLAAQVTGLRSDRGQVGCMLFASADGFPKEPKRALERVFVPIRDHRATCTFAARSGSYAILAMHDENGNGLMDRNFLGIPKEGFGASQGAHGAFGPKFADARFDYAGGASLIPITIRY